MAEEIQQVKPIGPVLEYGRPGWGPWLFRPSWLALVLVFGVAGAGVYLSRHRSAWVEEDVFSTIRSNYNAGAFILEIPPMVWFADGNLIIKYYDLNSVRQTIDVINCKSREISSTTTDGFSPQTILKDFEFGITTDFSKPIYARIYGNSVEILDIASGSLLRRFPRLATATGYYLAYDGNIFFCDLSNSGPDEWAIWRISATGDDAPRRLFAVSGVIGGTFTPIRVRGDLLVLRNIERDLATVWKLSDRRKIYDGPGSNVITHPDSDTFAVISSGSSMSALCTIHRGSDGKEIGRIRASGDTEWIANRRGDRIAGIGTGSSGVTSVCLWNGITTQLMQRRTIGQTPGFRLAGFFASDKRILLDGYDPFSGAILDAYTLRTLWLFPPGQHFAAFSEDERQMVLQSERPDGKIDLHIYRHVGRESVFGVFGMPQCWVVMGLRGLVVLVLIRDARRSAMLSPSTLVNFIVLGMIFCGTLGTLGMLVDGCLGKVNPNPGPLLLLAGLLTLPSGRGWRMISSILLLLLSAWAVYKLHYYAPYTRWFRNADGRAMWLFDRQRWVPVVGITRTLLVLAAISAIGAAALGRSVRAGYAGR